MAAANHKNIVAIQLTLSTSFTIKKRAVKRANCRLTNKSEHLRQILRIHSNFIAAGRCSYNRVLKGRRNHIENVHRLLSGTISRPEQMGVI